MSTRNEERSFEVEEHPQVPWLSVVFGYGPMLPIAAGGLATASTSGDLRQLLLEAGVAYATTILAFLAGVRRGLSFRTAGGPTWAQIATMLVLYSLALVAGVGSVFGAMKLAVIALLIGFAAIAILDPWSARRGEAPLFFARLRPFQMPIALLGLIAFLVAAWHG